MKEHIFKNYTALVFRNRPFLAKLMNPDFKLYRFLIMYILLALLSLLLILLWHGSFILGPSLLVCIITLVLYSCTYL